MWIDSRKEMPKEEGTYLVLYLKNNILKFYITQMYIGQETTMCESPMAKWAYPSKNKPPYGLSNFDVTKQSTEDFLWWKK